MSEKLRSFPIIHEPGLQLGHSKILRLACEPLGQQNNIYSTNLHTRTDKPEIRQKESHKMKTTKTGTTATDIKRQFYYRPLSFYGGKILKCAGHGAENPEHRAFYEKHFNTHLEGGQFMPGVQILSGYHGDRIAIIAVDTSDK
jgi:hypothetical protein